VKTDDFDYELPPELIASHPPEKRDGSRMLVVDRASGEISHRRFEDFREFVRPGDLLALNDTRVIPARFFSNDGRIELLQLEKLSETRWRCMVKPGKRMKVGRSVKIGEATGVVEEILEDGTRVIEFDREIDAETHGHLALPPYIKREDESSDRERYQTVFGTREGAIAAPTAGLHFTEQLLAELPHVFVTLHVGVGTFLPVKVDDVREHRMHTERFELSGSAARAIGDAGRVVSIGTTVVRVLEHCARTGMPLEAQRGETDIFIYPPYDFQVVDSLLTNFHLPKSTLLMLVSALAGKELIEEAYAKAVEERYRFFSYGDCMLIL
jgi:S-adenosylmethionine:tRNA ribosyltransferase-isomerase